MVETQLVVSYPFTKTECKQLKIIDSSYLNGFYDYDLDKICVILGSKEFALYKTNETLINLFTKVITHELLHREIYIITKNYMNDTEDKFVMIMSGQNVQK